MMVSPEAPTVAGLGEISTEAGGPVTTTTSVSTVNWFNVAVTVYDAVASAVTCPVEETVRPAGLLEDQVTGRSTNVLPAASRTVAVIWYVPPVVEMVSGEALRDAGRPVWRCAVLKVTVRGASSASPSR